MTVKELIEVLKKMPEDAVVLYRACSDWHTLEPGDVDLVQSEDKKIIYRDANGYSDFNPRWVPVGKEAEYNNFPTVVTFPGN